MVGRLRSALRAYALEGHDGGRVVERLNRLLWTEAEESQMATMLYVIVDPAASTVRWVNAGHPPPLVIVARRGALPRGRRLGAARRAAVPDLRGGHGAARAPATRSSSTRTGSSSVPASISTTAWPSSRRACARRPRTRTACSTTCSRRWSPSGGARRRRGAARAAQPARAGALQRRVPGRAGVARADPQHAAPLARATPGQTTSRSPRSPPPAARRPPTRSSTRAPQRRALRGVRAARRARGGDRGARPRHLAHRARGRPRQGLDLMRTLMDTVAVEPGEQGTTVSLRRRLGQRERRRLMNDLIGVKSSSGTTWSSHA